MYFFSLFLKIYSLGKLLIVEEIELDIWMKLCMLEILNNINNVNFDR